MPGPTAEKGKWLSGWPVQRRRPFFGIQEENINLNYSRVEVAADTKKQEKQELQERQRKNRE